MCNFLTHDSMTKEFAEEIDILTDSLTSGGVPVAIGSSRTDYNAIFDQLARLATHRNQTFPLSLNHEIFRAHTDEEVHEIAEDAILDCLRHFETIAPREYALIRDKL